MMQCVKGGVGSLGLLSKCVLGGIIQSRAALPSPALPALLVPSRGFAARKGTRSKRAKAKVKKEEVKKVFLFDSVRKAMNQPYKRQRPIDDSILPVPIDNVFSTYVFRPVQYAFPDAVQNFKELYHPTMYNIPNAPVLLRVNLDLKYPNRPNKVQDGWRSVIEMPAPFQLEGMMRPSVLAFCCEDADYIKRVLEAGAEVAGGKEIIKSIQEGEINAKDYEYLVAHPSIVPDLSAIRGLIKKKFPNVRNRTISVDLDAEVKRLKSGVKIRLETNDREPDYGYFDIPIGTLDMAASELETNFVSVMKDTAPRRVSGKPLEDFFISCQLHIKHDGRNREHFKIDLTPYLQDLKSSSSRKKEQDFDTEEVAVAL